MIAQDLRFLLLYPVNVAVGLAWAYLFWRRWHRGGRRLNEQSMCNGEGNLWAALLGAAVTFQGLTGILSLWLRAVDVDRWGGIAGWLFTVGVSSITVIIMAGAAVMIWREWRNDGGNGGKHE